MCVCVCRMQSRKANKVFMITAVSLAAFMIFVDLAMFITVR